MFTNITIKAKLNERLHAFYQDVLGMQLSDSGWRFEGESASLSFIPSDSLYQPTPADGFWKIGITVVDLDAVCQWLRSQGINVSAPRQFQDIGYLAHLSDPNGLTIELLQTTFEGNKPQRQPLTHPIADGAALAHITLRCHDERAMQKWADRLGLTLKSIQPVSDYGFTLYFYSFIDEPQPESDLRAVGNREWLWQRPYTLLEFQLVHDAPPFALPSEEESGLFGVEAGGKVITPQTLKNAGLGK
ncbi:glyoxalase/bleomycin resistance protein/dioxygenase [Grimontia sp. AD028]|uniref:VOC family protein n=1 Tax=Grimontia sp. AD028 TaxID=1581149 RepID=UPI00061ABF62|nr:VOC family protein [Grimontia sp. AD028]KKD60692.1 glyoxalase/bleomycin resistance protein/dioxygenase [Grimontia sp. AD028]